MQLVACEQVMEQLNRDRALSDRRRHAFRRTVPDIPSRENPRHARFEQEWTAGEGPSAVVGKICSREDETLVIPLDLRWQPLCVRVPSDHEEERVGVNGFLASPQAIGKHQVFQPPVTPAADDLGPETDLHVRCGLHLAYQVVRHPGAERLRTYHERDAPGVTSEVQRSLSS
jgi:hypothetical protein